MGLDSDTALQVLNSVDGPLEAVPLSRGDRLYGFTSRGYAKDANSPYWLTEQEFREVRRRHYRDGAWDREGVKQELALPCYNRVDEVAVGEVLEEHVGLGGRVGPARETITYPGDAPKQHALPGGGRQVTPGQGKIGIVPADTLP